MKAGKIILIIIGSLLALGIIGYAINRAINNSANDYVFKAIPEDAQLIGVINLEAFMTLALTNLPDIWELSNELGGEESSKEKVQQEISNSGLNFSRKVVVFLKDEELTGILPVRSESQLKSFLDDMVEKRQVEYISDNTYYSRELRSYVIFNDDLCIITPGSKQSSVKAINSFNNLLENTIKDNKNEDRLDELANSDKHFSLFMAENTMASESPFFKKSPATLTELSFEDGFISVITNYSHSDANVSSPLKDGSSQAYKSDYLSFHTNFNMDFDYEFWLSDRGIREIGQLTKEDFFKEYFTSGTLWTGLNNAAIYGSEKTETEIIDYSYDENFNLIETPSTKEIDVILFSGAMYYDGDFKATNMIPEEAEKANIYSNVTEGKYIISSSKEKFTPETTTTDNSVEIMVNPEKLLSLAGISDVPDFRQLSLIAPMLDEITLKAKNEGNEIHGELRLEMKDKDKNSLIYILSQLKQFARLF